MCLYPKLIKNRKYTKTKKNKGVIPELKDPRKELVAVGCGKCMECMKQKSRNWQVRLHEEIKENKNGIFVTLTFSNESIKELNEVIDDTLEGYERNNEIAKVAIRRFLERWRKKYKKSVRHWLVTELGHNGTENIHLHGIIWTNEDHKEIDRIWKYGYTWLSKDNNGFVNEKTINYIVKYINKVDEKHKEYKPRILTSAGIGKGYINSVNFKLNKYKKNETKEYYRLNNGAKINLPIYYRNYIYSDEEKEKLWEEKLDSEIRYVNGIKIDMSEKDSDKNLIAILEEERRKNKRLGYGNDEVNWERRIYEKQIANKNFKKRLK